MSGGQWFGLVVLKPLSTYLYLCVYVCVSVYVYVCMCECGVHRGQGVLEPLGPDLQAVVK